MGGGGGVGQFTASFTGWCVGVGGRGEDGVCVGGEGRGDSSPHLLHVFTSRYPFSRISDSKERERERERVTTITVLSSLHNLYQKTMY